MASSPAQKIDSLTALRFIAAASVVAAHAPMSFQFSSWPNPLLGAGVAVSFFFVLSGFILTITHPDLGLSKRQIGRFLRARFARVWPGHFLGFLLVLWLLPKSVVRGGFGPCITNLLLLHSAVPVTKYFLSYNDVSWSISVEAFFYLAFPFLLITGRRSLPVLLAIGIACVAAQIYLCHRFNISFAAPDDEVSGLGMLYMNPVARMLEFILGMATGLLFLRAIKTDRVRLPQARLLLIEGAGFAAAGIAIYLSAQAEVLPWGGASWAGYANFWLISSGALVGFASLIFALAYTHIRGLGPIGRMLSLRLCVYLGEISFAVYILHHIVLRYFDTHMPFLEKLHLAKGACVTYAAYWIVTMLLSWACYELWETPLRRRLRGKLKTTMPPAPS